MATKGQHTVKKVIPAGVKEKISVTGEFLFLNESSGELTITLEGSQASLVMDEGDKSRSNIAFPGFWALNETGADITVVFVVGFGDFEKGTLVGTVTLSNPTTLTTWADVAVGAAGQTLVSANAATKRETIIRNPIGSGITFRVGDSNTGAARGMELGSGEQVTINGTAAVYIYNPGAASSVNGFEVHD